ncbi:Predicted membrane protein [Providencia stuartii]|nr:Predicted membrane protein [Providencia stuartii]
MAIFSQDDKFVSYALTASTLISSWLLLPTGFTMHYAHLYYSNSDKQQPWLRFPDKLLEPSYSDFMYFLFLLLPSRHKQRMLKLPQLLCVVRYCYSPLFLLFLTWQS